MVDAAGAPVSERGLVREVASIVVMCELAEELSGGGELDELRARLAQLRMTEQPPGIEAAEEAALELERAIGAPPRVASPAFLDAVGAATLALEQRARRARVAVRERAPLVDRRGGRRSSPRSRRGTGCRSARVRAWKAADSDSRSAAIRRISSAACASSRSSRPSRCRRRSASSSRR